VRLFTAIDLTADVLYSLERLLTALRPEALINWSPLDNLHITTKFIGTWPESRLDDLHRTLNSLPRREPFHLELKDLGWFPSDKSPRVLWSGVHGGQALCDLVRDTEESLAPLGIEKETRPFTPHLTLARIKSPVPLNRLRQKVRDMQPAHLGSIEISQFVLYSSEPGSNSSTYRKLRTYRFESALAAS
jgi:RNA 2',3'-cyclic 3'-phosphodiesterase